MARQGGVITSLRPVAPHLNGEAHVLRIQAELLRLLKEIDDICRRHGITYYLSGGSVLGAVRNEGFLPWDDDVDVFMTRSEWQRFLEAVRHDLPTDRELVCRERFADYGNVVPRYVNTSTTMILPHFVTADVPTGLCIDFFLLDPLPDDPAAAKRYGELFRVYAELVSPHFMVNRRSGLEDSLLDLELYREYESRMRQDGRGTVLKALEDQLFIHDESDCSHYYLRWGVKRVIYAKEIYGPPRLVPFEDMTAPLTTGVFDALRIDYGDSWRMVPKKAAQVVHHPVARDLDHSYHAFTNDYKRFLPHDTLTPYLRRKAAVLAAQPQLTRARTLLGGLEAARVRLHVRAALAGAAGTAHTTPSSATDPFTEYHRAQFSGSLRAWAVPVGLDDDELVQALTPLIDCGEYFHAVDALTLRQRDPREWSAALEQLRDLIEGIRQLTLALDYKDFEKAQALLDMWRPHRPHAAPFHRAILRIKLEQARQSGEAGALESVLETAQEALALHPADGECMCRTAEALRALGRHDEAVSWFQRTMECTRDGTVLLAARKALEGLGVEIETKTESDAELVSRTMTPAQERLVELLREIDQICDENSIRYHLWGSTALRAYRYGHYVDDAIDMEVLMTAAEAKRFARAVEGRADRVVERAENGGLYYTDRTTLCIDIEQLDARTHGLRVAICVVCTRPPANAAGGWLLRQIKHNAMAILRRRPRRTLVCHPGKPTPRPFEASNLRYVTRVPFCGAHFPLPLPDTSTASAESLFFETVGPDWRRGPIKGRLPDDTVVCDATIGYEDVLREAGVQGVTLASLREAASALAPLEAAITAPKRTVVRFQHIARRTADRFALAQTFAPLKPELERLETEGATEQVAALLEPYAIAASRNLRHGLGLCFDPELLAMLCRSLARAGEQQLARAIERAVPPEHREPLRLSVD